MNKFIRIIVLIGLIIFLAAHYLVMSIDKEYFPMFAYLYPFVAKVWFETGRLLLAMNLHIDLSKLFHSLRYLFLLNIALAIFAFKYQILYKLILWIMLLLCVIYLALLIILGLIPIYPLYSLAILSMTMLLLPLIKRS